MNDVTRDAITKVCVDEGVSGDNSDRLLKLLIINDFFIRTSAIRGNLAMSWSKCERVFEQLKKKGVIKEAPKGLVLNKLDESEREGGWY